MRSQPETNPVCSIDGCDRPAGTRGWCSRHYDRWKRHGDPLGGAPGRGHARAFMESAFSYEGNDCLIWPYCKVHNGYGCINISGRKYIVSRLVCAEVNGPPPTPGHEAAHSCGNGHLGCVNPRHLRWASRAENMQEMVDQGRSCRGERHARSKLSKADVISIKAMLGKVSQSEIAEKFGVNQSTIGRISTGEIWSWLEAA